MLCCRWAMSIGIGHPSLTFLPAGTIDEIQRLHIRRVPLHEQPRRIVHQAQTRTLAVLTEIQGHTVGSDEPDRCFIRLLDDQVSSRSTIQQKNATTPFRVDDACGRATIPVTTWKGMLAREHDEHPAPAQLCIEAELRHPPAPHGALS